MHPLKEPTHYEQLLEQAARDRIPISVLAELTGRCVHRCRHCYTGSGDTRPDAADELTTAAWLDVFDQLAAAGTLFLTLSGGEPLLRADFWGLLDEAVRRGFHTRVFTSGYTLDEEAAARLAASGAAGVDISFYSCVPAVFDAVSGVRGSFDRVMRAIELLTAAGFPPRLKTPVMRTNAPTLAETWRFARDRGWTFLVDFMLVPPVAGVDRYPERLDGDELAAVLAEVREFLEPAEPRPDQAAGTLCSAGFRFCAIDPAGRVFACNFHDRAAGDLRRERFLDVWRTSPVLEEFRRLSRAAWAACRSCVLDAVCPRCPAFSARTGGTFTELSDAACRLGRLRAEAPSGSGVPPDRNSGVSRSSGVSPDDISGVPPDCCSGVPPDCCSGVPPEE
jgi:radical SAM protein with 4Fe4S-binding SPASM domain